VFKKIFLVISFVAIFFYQTPIITPKVFAASETSKEEDIFKQIWESIKNFLFPPLIPTTTDSSKESLISSRDTRREFTDYTKQDKDWSQRSLTQAVREKLIGVWFNEVITRPGLFSEKQAYPDNVVSEAKGRCPEIKITNIIYYFATRTDKKILYARGNSSPIDYPDLSQYASSLGASECYENAYKGIQSVPQGIFEDEGDARLSSTQINDQLGLILPQDKHGIPRPNDNDTAEKTEALVKNSVDKHNKVRHIMIPQRIQNQEKINDKDSEIEKTTQVFKKVIQPQVFQGKIMKNHNASSNKGNTTNNCQGMDRQGAYDMAITDNKTYQEILTTYYGTNFNFGSVNSAIDKITVKPTDLVNCDEITNEYSNRFQFNSTTLTLSVEDYLLGLAEIDIDWPLASHKAQTIAARNLIYINSNNLNNPIGSSDTDPIFSCSRLLSNLQAIDNENNNNQTEAVKSTAGVVLTQNGVILKTPYSDCDK